LALTLVLTALLIPSLSQPASAAVTITARFVAAIANGLSPTDSAWNQATQFTVPLDSIIGPTGVPQLLPSSKWRYLKVKAIHNGTDIFFRYEWTDSTSNTLVDDAPKFADAVAMEIPFVTPSTVAMGNQREPVNIIFWRADMENPLTPGLGHPQNIVAGGAGTVQTSPDSDLLPITQSQTKTAAGWTVIFKRPLVNASTSGNMVALARTKSYRICFAQWDGANEERNGLKMVAGSWHTLFVQ
jgi:DMSO reductase family type II enzyme heme b subunit